MSAKEGIEGIIFDLDETLIHGNPRKGTLRIRRGCRDFLKYVIDNFNVGIWTFASKSWANIVVKKLFTTEQQDKLIFIYHGEMTCPRKGGDIKCLTKIWNNKCFRDYGFTPSSTLIFEDKLYNCGENMENAVIVPQFTGQKDDVLPTLKEYLKKYKNEPAINFPKNIEYHHTVEKEKIEKFPPTDEEDIVDEVNEKCDDK